MIAIIGAGGKTTTMYALADAQVKKGRNVICTTSTHIRFPKDRAVLDAAAMTAAEFEKRLRTFFADSESESESDSVSAFVSGNGRSPEGASDFGHDRSPAATTAGKCLVVGCGSERPSSKLSSPPEGFFSLMQKYGDLVIVEADGAKMLPLKVSAAHEPSLPAGTKAVIAVAGLSSLGRPAADVCFRLSVAEELFGWRQGHVIAEEDFVKILTDEKAGLKHTEGIPKLIVLNQADTAALRQAGERIKTGIEEYFLKKQEEKVTVWIVSHENRETIFAEEEIETIW